MGRHRHRWRHQSLDGANRGGVTRVTPLTLYREWIVQAARQRGWGAFGPARAGPSRPPLPGTTSAIARWSTLAYAEKVRPQFLSLRQHFRSSAFSMGGMAANPSIKLGFSKSRTLLESAELGDLLPGDGIFLQSFVLRRFSIVLEK